MGNQERKEKQCTNCSLVFSQPISRRSAICNKCRHLKEFKPCICGKVKYRGSIKCQDCINIIEHGPQSRRWKGGRVTKRSGYIITYHPGHPRGHGNNKVYVFEHTLVLEAKIGRYLLPGESAHHLNGIRDDNRPENLELWCKPQKPGIRAKDALAWAREIIKRYEPIEDKLK